MILRQGTVDFARIVGSRPRSEAALGKAGGLTNLGVNLVRLEPGERSSERHWHANSDEFLYVVQGTVTVVENDGAHDLRPGDSACWPAGVDNAHTVENRTDSPIEYLVAGTNPACDLVRYPDVGRTLHHNPPEWQLIGDDGTVIKQGQIES